MSILNFIGALTNKPYAFQHRPWELTNTNTIDISDSIGSHIKVYTYGSEIKRILPGSNMWISNKTRYFFEGLIKWRVNVPMIRNLKNLMYVSWTWAFFFVCVKLWFLSFFTKKTNIVLLQNFLIDYELLVTSKLLTKKIGVYLYLNAPVKFNDFYTTYISPGFFKEIVNCHILFFLGANMRLEAPILAIKLRKNLLKNTSIFFCLGNTYNDSLNSVLLGVHLKKVIDVFKGKLHACNLILKTIKIKNKILFSKNTENKILFFIGNSLTTRTDNLNIIKYIQNFEKIALSTKYKYFDSAFKFFTYNVNICAKTPLVTSSTYLIHLYLTSLLYKELNIYQNIHMVSNIKEKKIIYTVGNVELNVKNAKLYIYQGHHINEDYLKVDVIFPSITFFEKASRFINMEGMLLKTNIVMSAPQCSRNDWSILNALYLYLYNFVKKLFKLNLELKKKTNYLNSKHLNSFINKKKKLFVFIKKFSVNFYFKKLTNYASYNFLSKTRKAFNTTIKLYNSLLYHGLNNFYCLDVISKNSKTMQLTMLLNLKKNYVINK